MTTRRRIRDPERGAPSADGFTLIEVLAAVFLTAVVMTVAIAFFVQLSDSTDAAERKARDGRLALAVLDRIARDLEGAYLLAKPPDVDPNLQPWIFLAESDEGDSASDRVKFASRSNRPKNPLDHGSDLAMVTYLLHPADDEAGYELLRAVTPGLPEGLDREFPSAQDERFMLVANRIESFGMRFLDENGEWLDDWDSSLLEQSGQLPRAAEIEISFVPAGDEARDEPEDFGPRDADEEDRLFVRRVNLPMQPVDLAAMLQAVADEAQQQDQQNGQNRQSGQNTQNTQNGAGGAGTQAGGSLDVDDLDLPEGFDPGLLEQMRNQR
jgi:prepilin-type N-terminal cleavage/methylation domain-containing protein